MPQQKPKITRNSKGQFSVTFGGSGPKYTQSLEQKIKTKLLQIGPQQAKNDALKWLRSVVQEFKNSGHSKPGKTSVTSSFSIGNLFFYFYDAKTKQKLPFWDKFPLLLPIESYGDGFLGLNLHYLPVTYRIKLLNALMGLATDKNMDENTRLRVSYGILKGASRYKAFQPCVKRYLYSQLRSKFLSIPSNYWAEACLLPVQQFQKAGAATVWADSMKKIS